MENHNFDIRAVIVKYIIYFFNIYILVSPSLEVQVCSNSYLDSVTDGGILLVMYQNSTAEIKSGV
jgi:hypothetical protein